MKLFIITGDMVMSIFASLKKMGAGPIFFVSFFWLLVLRRLYGEKTMRKAKLTWFLSEGEKNDENKWGLAPFILGKSNVF